jgi:hypothetical protein
VEPIYAVLAESPDPSHHLQFVSLSEKVNPIGCLF